MNYLYNILQKNYSDKKAKAKTMLNLLLFFPTFPLDQSIKVFERNPVIQTK